MVDLSIAMLAYGFSAAMVGCWRVWLLVGALKVQARPTKWVSMYGKIINGEFSAIMFDYQRVSWDIYIYHIMIHIMRYSDI